MKSLFRSVSLLIVVSLSALLTGCGSKVSFTAATKASLRGASVQKASQYPNKDQILIYGFSDNMAGVLGGALGAGLAAAAKGDTRAQVAELLKIQKIDPGLILSANFERELARVPLWPKSTGPADAEFQFKVGVVGLMIRHGLTTYYSPYLTAEGKLVGRDGKILWQQVSYVLASDVRHTMKDYLEKPGVLNAAYETAARDLSRGFLSQLHTQSGGKDPIKGLVRTEQAAEDARLDAEEAAADRAEDERERLEDEAKRARKEQEAAAKRAKKEQAAAARAAR